ncbi:MAG: Flp family type IVb pilin, partial [Gemmataceae bacterium]
CLMSLMRRLWADDQGAIISVEWILFVAILIFGLIPGLVALRNSIDAAMGTIGNVLMTIVPNFTFSGFGIGNQGVNIAQVGGYTFTPSTNIVLTSVQIAPIDYTGSFVQVDPAP